MRSRWFDSESQYRLKKTRHHSVGRVVETVEQRLEAVAGNQDRDAEAEDHVVVQVRPVFGAQAQVGADRVLDIFLKNELLQRLDAVEPEEVGVVDQAKPGGDLE